MYIPYPSSPSGVFKSFSSAPRCRHLLQYLTLFLFLSYTLAAPTTVTPANGNVILDVGQKTEISKQNWALGVILILVGLVLVFYGFKFIRLTLLVAGFLSSAVAIIMSILAFRWDFLFLLFDPRHYVFWIWVITGLAGAILSFRYWDVGVTFTGAFGGFAIAMGIIALANLSITNVGRYVILIVLILGGAAIATFFERLFIICGSSFGGAYALMFGVDQFAQVGYREMVVIFDFRGKTLTYHPNLQVYIMLGSSLLLAGLGVAWEFWHHSRPILMDREAVFRIYGRPFGKRPKRLVGQKIHHHLKTRSDVYAYLIGCFCFKRWSVDDVLYEDECCAPEPTPTTPPQVSVPGEGLPAVPGEQGASETKEPKATTPLDGSGTPLKSDPVESSKEKPTGTSDHDLTEVVVDGQHPESSAAHNEQGHEPPHQDEQKETTQTEGHSPEPAGPSSSPPRHPLFAPTSAARTAQLIRLMSEDTSPGNTIPSVLLEHYSVHPAGYAFGSLWPLSSSTSSLEVGSTSSLLPSHGLHMLEVSEDSNEAEDDEEIDQGEEDVPPRPIIEFQEIVEK
ncbi:hypothetical protein B0O80DRAFT_462276 [Mortierella sp. GBAus27b]|nr:hypothetical protein BGX31_000764 [Mortierella sp. GBA43]KAI8348796.1 hypothetical protein B0O80DRAFT_462276 [Mortierella sp. GBAus27b]